jgi:Ras family.
MCLFHVLRILLLPGEYELPDGAQLTLDILDTSGAYQFPAMRELSISTADAFVLVYAVDDASTWDVVKDLREQVMKTLSNCFDLVGWSATVLLNKG